MTNHSLGLPKSRRDERRSNRVPIAFQMMLVLHEQGKETGHTIWTLNISPAGARIKLEGSLIPGQTIQLLPAEDARNAYPCRVVWFSPAGREGMSEAGLEFKTPWTISRQNFDIN